MTLQVVDYVLDIDNILDEEIKFVPDELEMVLKCKTYEFYRHLKSEIMKQVLEIADIYATAIRTCTRENFELVKLQADEKSLCIQNSIQETLFDETEARCLDAADDLIKNVKNIRSEYQVLMTVLFL